MGSPPRMRGKLEAEFCEQVKYGITPADAGKTYIKSQPDVRIRDHPRGCGENLANAGCNSKIYGSPPRMRGKPDAEEDESERNRITPADAGKTWVFLPFI